MACAFTHKLLHPIIHYLSCLLPLLEGCKYNCSSMVPSYLALRLAASSAIVVMQSIRDTMVLLHSSSVEV